MAVTDRIDKAWHLALCRSGLRAAHNRLRYGAGAPRPDQLLQVAPDDIVFRYAPKANGGRIIGSRETGRVRDGDWDRCVVRYAKNYKYRACAAHFRDGLPWEDTGIVARMLDRIARTGPFDNCATRADIEARYARLDRLWALTTARGELPLMSRRARDGIVVHIDRNGGLVFGNQGFHRLAIAKLAHLPRVPVSLGVVHPDALRSGAFGARCGPDDTAI